jgi:ATP-dependent Lon protease
MDYIYINRVSNDIQKGKRCYNIEKQIRNILYEIDEIEKLDNNKDSIKSKINKLYDLSFLFDDCKKN